MTEVQLTVSGKVQKYVKAADNTFSYLLCFFLYFYISSISILFVIFASSCHASQTAHQQGGKTVKVPNHLFLF